MRREARVDEKGGSVEGDGSRYTYMGVQQILWCEPRVRPDNRMVVVSTQAWQRRLQV